VEEKILKQPFYLQRLIFESNPSRLQLVEYEHSGGGTEFRILVCRNHAFEPVASVLGAVLDYAGICPNWIYSDYDDTLSFSNIDANADLLILWIDFSRYKNVNAENFVAERIKYLRTLFKKNILVAPFKAENFNIKEPGVFILDMAKIKNKLADKYIDERMASFAGTSISSSACIECAREMGLKYIPALLKEGIKAVITDLDNTLYNGVLGEDGPEGLVISEGHKKLQQAMKSLSEKGVFLCVASKNNLADVEKLFEIRTDFILKRKDFSVVQASWQPKDEMIKQIAHSLNIHESACLFIDDNIGEAVSVQTAMPSLHTILACENAGLTAETLLYYPGVFKLAESAEDVLRKSDAAANAERSDRLSQMSKEDYLKSLEMRLTIKKCEDDGIARFCELAGKTNQFIFSYKRYTQHEVNVLLKDNNAAVLNIFLKDNLSDSGMIGGLVLKKYSQGAQLEELFISCRALGRSIEDIMIFSALAYGMELLKASKLRINFVKGERNEPACSFAQNNLKEYLKDFSEFLHPEKQSLKQSFITISKD